MIIDAHSHWLPGEIISNAHFYSKAWGDIDAQLKLMQAQGIDKAVLSYPTSDAHLKLGSMSVVSRIFNDNVAEIVKRFPDKFIGAAVLPTDNADDMIIELRRSREELGFKAVSLASSYNGKYLDDKLFIPLYKEIAGENIPIFVHSQTVNPIGFERVQDPLRTPVIEYIFDMTMCAGKLLMSGILRDYPNLKFIFANFAGATPLLKDRFDATYNMLRSVNFVKDLKGSPSGYLKNIYVDTGGDANKSNLCLALEMFGAKQILWGSDWPAKKDASGSIAAVKELAISEEDINNILGGNLERMLPSKGMPAHHIAPGVRLL